MLISMYHLKRPGMALAASKLHKFLLTFRHSFFDFSSVRWVSVSNSFEESVKSAVETKSYEELPDILTSSNASCQNPNPFLFLSDFPLNVRTHIVSEILQSLVSLRPRSRPRIVYSSLLSCILQSRSPLPLGFVILQRILRSGCLPVPQTHLSLSTAWLRRRARSDSVETILSEMKSTGCDPDGSICNYLILSLCKVEQFTEATKVLKNMAGAGCIPDVDSYGALIREMCRFRMTSGVSEMLREMVANLGLHPRQDILVKVAAAFRANREIWKAVEMIEFLASNDVHVGFECYESVLEACAECHEFVLGGKVVMKMTDRGLIPYIKARQKIVVGLANVSEWELASAVRQRFADLNC